MEELVLSLGLGYDVRLGALAVTPFAAPTPAYYGFASDDYKNGAQQWGWGHLT